MSRSWFYKWKDSELPPRAARRDRLAAEVRRLFAAHRGTYGSPRITADLRDAGWKVSENTVAAVMAEQGLAARRRKKRRSTTRPGKGRWHAADLLKPDFPAAKINQKWYGDGTEIPTGQGKLYLASVLDMASRRVLGFALGERHDAALAYGALACGHPSGALPELVADVPPYTAPLIDTARDREVEQIAAALASVGPLERRRLAQLVRADLWGPGRFSPALHEAVLRGKVRRTAGVCTQSCPARRIPATTCLLLTSGTATEPGTGHEPDEDIVTRA